MRLKSIEIAGFRGFPGRHRFDLDAEAVIVVGANGQGKTSLFDAVLWGLTGELSRLGKAKVVSLYSQTGGARVELELSDADGGLWVARSEGEGQDGVRVRHGGGEQLVGPVAEAHLLDVLWPHTSGSKEGDSPLTAATTRGVYLQQDLVRQFIEGESHQDRFRAISELVGAGAVSDLTIALDKSKTAWSAATNSQAELLDRREAALRSDEARLEGLSESSVSGEEELREQWAAWWADVGGEGGSEGAPPALEGTDASRRLDAAVKELAAVRAAASRRSVRLEDLADRLAGAHEEPVADLDQLRADAAAASEAARRSGEALRAAQAAAAERRRLQVARRDQAEELRALAEIALRHLDGPCPVCGQGHDHEGTRERMLQAIAAASEASDPEPETLVAASADELARLEAERDEAAGALAEAEAARREYDLKLAELTRELAELGLEPGEAAGQRVEELASAERARVETLGNLLGAGEQLALALARVGERARRHELEGSVATARAEVAEMREELEARKRTRELAGQILEQLRDASTEVVATRLDEISPILQRIYRTIDPHPALRELELQPSFSGRRGQLAPMLNDRVADKGIDQPAAVLSSSQLNALAVSIFLALNLGLPRLPLETMMLDDPLHSLDDINLLGLIDLLRRTKRSRQMLISTHDPRFARLLVKKLRPVGEDRRTRVITLEGWSRSGPRVLETDAPSEERALRIVA